MLMDAVESFGTGLEGNKQQPRFRVSNIVEYTFVYLEVTYLMHLLLVHHFLWI